MTRTSESSGLAASTIKVIFCILAIILVGPNKSTSINPPSSLDADFDSVDSESGGSMESNLKLPLSKSVECEPLALKMCSKMPYANTRIPNFFGDSSQIEAADRAQQFEQLAHSKCNPNIQEYLCELLTPVCLNDTQRAAMTQFEIYPCRPFCRKVARDCDSEIKRINKALYSQGGVSISSAFACEQLPFESNPGGANPTGPCHDTPAGQNQWKSNAAIAAAGNDGQQGIYHPFDNRIDNNKPPFITDTSSLDILSGSRTEPVIPPLPTGASNPGSGSRPQTNQQPDNNQSNKSIVAQIYSNLLWIFQYLTRYPNVLSVATMLFLLVALNSRRLGRLKACFKGDRSGGQMKGLGRNVSVFPPNSSDGLVKRHQLVEEQLSPSTSSRSLVLLPGNPKRVAGAAHSLVAGLVDAEALVRDHQKQMIATSGHVGAQKSSLINVNNAHHHNQQHQHQQLSSTLDRRFHIAQSSPVSAVNFQSKYMPFHHYSSQQHFANKQQAVDKQHLVNTLDSQSSSNQYDYIEVGGPPSELGKSSEATTSSQLGPTSSRSREQQQHLYNNILISSPNHQVLLFDNQTNNNSRHQESPGRSVLSFSRPPLCDPPLPPAGYMPTVMGVNMPSGYAAPSESGYTPNDRGSKRRRDCNHSSSSSSHQRALVDPASSTAINYSRRNNNTSHQQQQRHNQQLSYCSSGSSHQHQHSLVDHHHSPLNHHNHHQHHLHQRRPSATQPPGNTTNLIGLSGSSSGNSTSSSSASTCSGVSLASNISPPASIGHRNILVASSKGSTMAQSTLLTDDEIRQ